MAEGPLDMKISPLDMKPPITAAIPKSRNHRRTPPTPPSAHSPSPPARLPPSPPARLPPSPPGFALVGATPPSPLFAAPSGFLPARMHGATACMDIDHETDKASPPHIMEINSSYGTHLVKKEVSSPPPPLGSPSSRNDVSTHAPDHCLNDHNLQQYILQLKQQQQVQQQFLLEQYKQQQQHLAEQHEQQLQQHIKLQQNMLYHQFQEEHQRLLDHQQKELQSHLKQYLDQAKRAAEDEQQRAEKQRLEQDRLEALKKKEKHKQSAIASSEVKQRLQEVILQKKQREAANSAAAAAAAGPSPSNYRNWPPGHVLAKYDDDFPLRKTVESGSTPDSGQSSPPNGIPTSRSSSGSTPIHEEGGGSPYAALGGGGQGSCSDLTLYSSPSLPNISLGRPPHSTQTEGGKLPIVSEAEVRAAMTARMGMPLTGHVLPSTLPYYPTLPVIDGEGHSTSPVIGRQMVTTMETSGSLAHMPGLYPPGTAPLNDAQARLSRTLQRPLGRTQSAPLPLGNPMLQGTPPTFLPHGPPPGTTPAHQYDAKQAMDHQRNLLKQHIRQTVLTRSGSKNHVENVEEETEAAVAQAIAHDKTPEVIDLTERKMEESALVRQARERAMIFHPHRDPINTRHPPLHSVTGSAFTPRSGSHIARPLYRAFSSPLVTLTPQLSPQEPISINKQGATTGLAYDSLMLKHQCICGDNSHHPEHGGRLQSIWARLQETALVHRCHRLRSPKASLEEIQSCHSEAHALLFGTNPLNRQRLDMSRFPELPIKNFVMLQCGGIGVDSDTTWNELHTSSVARMAAGCVIDLSLKVATGELRNGFALVRPPGHHAEHQQAMGFCFFNSVAIAARQLQQKLNVEKILILDWDVHHGNGTQSMFYTDPHILYISIHRYDDGSFFPGTGAPTEVGEGDGYGFNVNIAWSGGINPPMGDAEYMAAFRSIVMPIAKDFDPDIVLVSAGFDAADGHPPPLGGYAVSAACFAHMTKQIMALARGKVVLALEGGYNLASICDASEACVRTLVGDDPPPLPEAEVTRPPCQKAIDTLQNVIAVQGGHWPVVRRQSALIPLSVAEALGREEEQETVSAMASLSVDHQNQNQSPEPSGASAEAGQQQQQQQQQQQVECGGGGGGGSSSSRGGNDDEEPMEEDPAEGK